ncbi:GNAT family N-acetyltransferase [Conexibacter woesei]|uniref:BioF2-like acetyltransferase domain-containing protein n=1 Tax=Conexibacter woesei (strain DSM 14684 / CCUG 47730 / CIP 108061 / JCM 11494 / NBRC 100937 / ID131577) TaxID=469383 RepID=D3F6H1_CONWI|nr:GNAT family N-acetyltransferase [Conexibacter woesei]ADB50738.1 protein of unknown function DUF482 [Conexibacter woesei DSM 14684]
MTLQLDVLRSVVDVDAEDWDGLVAAAGAPAFYHHAFLSALEQLPLHAVEDRAYVVGRDPGDGTLRCGVPTYLVRGVDPMRVLADHVPECADEPVLLSHVWHCYDGSPPVLGGDEHAWGEIVATVERLSREVGAARFCFANVEDDSEAARGLTIAGIRCVEIDRRFVLDLAPVADYEAYLASISKGARSNLRRYQRIADDAGVELRTLAPEEADLDAFVQLARGNAAKYGNAAYYDEQRFPRFVRLLGETARVIELRHEGRLIAGGIVLIDAAHVHWWSVGYADHAVERLSPAYLVFAEIVRIALAHDVRWVECGRRNEAFKRRHGLTPRPLSAFVSPALN